MTSLQPSPQEAAEELLRRRRARRSLLDFTNYTYSRYQAERAHELVAEALDAVVEGEIQRLMIFAPPQHGKSELVSVRLPAYWFGRRPDDPIILCSYAATLANSKSKQAREIVESDEFARLFPGITTRRESRAADDWALVAPYRGSMLSSGVGGAITGRGAMLGIIDDPVENWEAGQSETIRRKTWDWYRTTFRTRVWEDGAIILIMTRWHEEDLAGMLLKEQADEWVILRLPALAETQAERDEANRVLGLPLDEADPLGRKPGEPLCPRRYSKQALLRIRRDVGPMGWASEYQGVPQVAGGNLAKREWFPIVDAAPAQASRVRYWDLAATAKSTQKGDPDWMVGTLMSRTDEGIYYIEHVVRDRRDPGQVEALIRQTAELDGKAPAICFEQEPGAAGKLFTAALIRLLAGWTVHAEPASGDKVTRAMPFFAQAEAGNVRLVRGAWNSEWLDEVVRFPRGAHDDQVDSASGAFGRLAVATSSLVMVPRGNRLFRGRQAEGRTRWR